MLYLSVKKLTEGPCPPAFKGPSTRTNCCTILFIISSTWYSLQFNFHPGCSWYVLISFVIGDWLIIKPLLLVQFSLISLPFPLTFPVDACFVGSVHSLSLSLLSRLWARATATGSGAKREWEKKNDYKHLSQCSEMQIRFHSLNHKSRVSSFDSFPFRFLCHYFGPFLWPHLVSIFLSLLSFFVCVWLEVTVFGK
jgi:hypothetical protein